MKKLLVIMLLLVSFTFAEVLVDIPWHGTGYMGASRCRYPTFYGANDIRPTMTGTISTFTIWITEVVAPTSLEVVFYYSTPSTPRKPSTKVSMPGAGMLGFPASYTLSEGTNIDVGGVSYYIQRCDITLDNSVRINGGVMYWISLAPIDGDWLWWGSFEDWVGSRAAQQYNGGDWDILTFDGFMVIEYEPASAIEKTTWGQIKAEL